MQRNRDIAGLRSERAFAELLGKATPRPRPPAADEAQVRAAVHAEWRKVAGSRLRRRRMTTFALAASVLLAVAVTFNLVRDPVGDFANLQVATIDKQFGDVVINSQHVSGRQMAAIEGNDIVATSSASGVALGWHDGGSLRIDENTVVVFEAANRIYLRQGRVYFDSLRGPLSSRPPIDGAADLEIRTDYGRLRHLGTQYMTRVGDDELVVSVREGVVSIDGNVTARASAGQQFAISASGELSIGETNGVDDWEWVEKSTPPVNLDGRFVSEALDWVSRESGRTIEYASQNTRRAAEKAELRGISALPPSRALEIFMMTTNLNARIEGEVIVISED